MTWQNLGLSVVESMAMILKELEASRWLSEVSNGFAAVEVVSAMIWTSVIAVHLFFTVPVIS
jgi:hypothetical protein